MTIAPEVARQYLKAMGIESWESRSAAVTESASSVAVQRAARWQGATQYSVESFVTHLAEAPIVESNQTTAQVLVVLEAPALQPESQALLASMLKAINIDLAQQAVVNLHAGGAETVQSVASSLNPRMILLMARIQSDLSELAILRNGIHRAQWTTAPIALTLHPGLLLSQPDLKRPAWEDLKRVKAVLDG